MHQNKYIYDFGTFNLLHPKEKLGNKGAGLADMKSIGINVPEGFTITTDLCKEYYSKNKQIPIDFLEELDKAIIRLEEKTGKIFGSEKDSPPLLLSIRSGAVDSMPGMMDTILNLGINKNIIKHLAQTTKNENFANNTYERFIDSYEKLVGTKTDDIKIQLISAIKAVLDSFMSDRAIAYRKIHNISEENGTAVNIQAMVFGNMGEVSGTGVLFTRNPSSGKKEIYGEFLTNAQGEDVVAGIRTPAPIFSSNPEDNSLYHKFPHLYKELEKTANILENYYLDMQDIEFTIENGHLYILQTRSGKRTTYAGV